jgi:transposase
VESVVAQLDLSSIEECYTNSGSAHYPPDVMLRLAVYSILDGVNSPRAWARKSQTCLATRYLAREQTPSISVCYRFRDKACHYIEELFKRVLELADADGLLTDEQASIDGTYGSALASRHRLVNEKTLDKRIVALEKVIEVDKSIAALEKASEVDKTLDATSIERVPTAKWMGKTPSGREEQIRRYQESKEVVQERNEKNRKRPKSERLDESKVFVSTSDPAVPISRDKRKVFGPLWPTQFVTHVTSGLIVAAKVFANPSDSGTIGTMLKKACQNTGQQIGILYADAGYTSQADIQTCVNLGVKLIAPVRENSFTQANREQRQEAKGVLPLFQKCDFNIDYEKMTCQCPNGRVVYAKGHGSRQLANGDSLKVSRFEFPPELCAGCPRLGQCKVESTRSRTLRVTEGESIVAEHLRHMTPEVLVHCRAIRAQTAEKAFADGKTRSGLERLGCKSITRANALTLLHVMAMNIKRLFTLRKNQENTE